MLSAARHKSHISVPLESGGQYATSFLLQIGALVWWLVGTVEIMNDD